MYSTAGITFQWNLLNSTPDILNDNACVFQAWSPAQTCYLAPGSKDSKEHVQHQLLGRWKEIQTHVLLLANCTNENNLDSKCITLVAKDDGGEPWARNHFNNMRKTLMAAPDSNTGLLRHVGMRCLSQRDMNFMQYLHRYGIERKAWQAHLTWNILKPQFGTWKFWTRTRKWRSASGRICLVSTVKSHIIYRYREEREAGLPLRN